MTTLLEDWETTCLIYPEALTSVILDSQGKFVQGWMTLTISLESVVFCRRMDPKRTEFRFWLSRATELEFQLWLYGHPEEEGGDHYYEGVEIRLLSDYPHDFPTDTKQDWLGWLHEQATETLRREQISYAVCTFVEHQCLVGYFQSLYDQTDGQTLIQFTDRGPTFYDTTTLVIDPCTSYSWYRHHPSGVREHITMVDCTPREKERILPVVIAWREWLPLECPICFDVLPPSQAITIASCGHSFCRLCISTYVSFKADEIHGHRYNPFQCPVVSCRRSMLIIACVKPLLPRDKMERVRAWYKDLKNPPCWSLPDGCLKQTCSGGGRLRKKAVDSYHIFCEVCKGEWCELCLRRIRNGIHRDEDCRNDQCMEFCERYMAANETAKQRCEAKWPWIKVYAKARIQDISVLRWIESNGQTCPGCKTGVERTEGCFHMTCQCGTHFCYECGAQIFPPFYGTHRCWERIDL